MNKWISYGIKKLFFFWHLIYVNFNWWLSWCFGGRLLLPCSVFHLKGHTNSFIPLSVFLPFFCSFWFIERLFKIFEKRCVVYVTFQHQNETCFWSGNDSTVNNQNTFSLQIHHTECLQTPRKACTAFYAIKPGVFQYAIVGKRHCKYMSFSFIHFFLCYFLCVSPPPQCIYPPPPFLFQ